MLFQLSPGKLYEIMKSNPAVNNTINLLQPRVSREGTVNYLVDFEQE